ncbi:MAG: queuosine precursor transporter [Gammaproteobacteria bacterium]|nr:queuosine precursor transporter [Gammaproteobacteria bacterium]
MNLSVNGAFVSGGYDVTPNKGYICLEAEGTEAEFKNIHILELPPSSPDTTDVAEENQGFVTLYILAESVTLPNGEVINDSVELFSLLYATTSGAVIASMVAYFAAQYCDVFLYHFWKGLTKGKHLWLRNNGSTMISQGVDSFMVIAVTFGAQFLAGAVSLSVMITLMTSNYLFKVLVALLDTIPLYICVHYLRPCLEIPEGEIGCHEI